MAAKTSWNDTAPDGVKLNGKTLEVTTYTNTVDLNADAFKDSGANAIDASKSSSAVALAGNSKSTTFTTGANGGTIYGGAGADKINLGNGADVVVETVGSMGNDAINNYDGSKDVIEITNRTSGQATFTDKGSSVVVTFSNSKEKLTVNKTSAGSHVALKFQNNETLNYGSPPVGVTFDDASKKTALNVSSAAANNTTTTIDASKIASTVKNINAGGATKEINIVGNGQANSITLGAGGGTVYGGYSYDASKDASKAYKATSDKLYGGSGKDVFVFDESLGGSDQIFNYDSEQGDVIKIKDKSSSEIKELLQNTKTFKDSGKNVVLTLNKSKLTIDGTPKQIFFVGTDENETVTYGPSLPSGAYIDQKKTTLYLTKDTPKQSDPIALSVNNTIYAEYNYAPKLKTIDASAYKGSVILGDASSTVATELKAGSGGSTLYGSSKDDVLYGGSVAGSADVFVYNVNSLSGGGKDKIYNFNGIEDGDVIKIADYDEAIHSLVLTEKSGKSLNITINNKATNKSIGQIDLLENPKGKTILIVDGNNKIIGTNPATTPIGLEYNEKTGIVTKEQYTGAYSLGSYLIGETLPDDNKPANHTKADAVIKASDYSSKLSVINAAEVSSSVHSLYIEGNENAKNVLTAPNVTQLKVEDDFDPLVDPPVLQTTLKGGLTQADVLNGSTLTGSQDFFYVTPSTKAKKDSIFNYDENDFIVIEKTQNISSLEDIKESKGSAKFDDKSADAVLTLDKSVVTVKDGAGKKLNLMLVDEDGKQPSTLSIGHILPKGLQYDQKKVTIAVKSNSTSEAADVGGDNAELGLDYNNDNKFQGYEGYIALNLNDTAYFSSVKTINLNKINDKILTTDDKPKIDDNSVHVTLLGNALANEHQYPLRRQRRSQ